MQSVKTWSNRVILVGWLLMAAGVAAFLSIIFVWAGVAMFLAGAALCILGGLGHALSSLSVQLRRSQTSAFSPSFVTARLEAVAGGLGGEQAFLVVKDGHAAYDVFYSGGGRDRVALEPRRSDLRPRHVPRCSGPLCQALRTGMPGSGVIVDLGSCPGPFCREWSRRGCTSMVWATFCFDVHSAALAVAFRDSRPVAPESLDFLRSVAADLAMTAQSKAA